MILSIKRLGIEVRFMDIIIFVAEKSKSLNILIILLETCSAIKTHNSNIKEAVIGMQLTMKFMQTPLIIENS